MRKLLVTLLLTLVIGMTFATTANNSDFVIQAQLQTQVKIMPLGDSITVGYNGTEGNPVVDGYRTYLYSTLVSNGFHVDFVGSQQNGTGLDNDNEGHMGYSANEIRDDVTGWLVSNPADVVLLHIGTNDIQSGQDVSGIVAEVETTLDNIYQWGSNNDRNVTVILARIILRSDPTLINRTVSYNNELQTMASTRITNGDHLIMVDMEHALIYPTDLVDGIHPTPIGYEKMATVWYNALTSLLSYSLTVNSAHGEVTKFPDQVLYPYGTAVNLSVLAANGWAFNAWSGDLIGSNNPESILMNSNKTVNATFTQNQYQLTMDTNFGSVSPASGNWYDAGTSVNIYAVSPGVGAGERYVWNGWTGSGSGSYIGVANNTNLVVMNGPVTETASWTHQFYLTVSSPYGDTGGEGWYDAGNSAYATISSTIATGSGGLQYTFSGWSGSASGSSSTSNIIVMDGPKTAIANWSPVPTATPKPTPTPTHKPTVTPTSTPTLHPTVSPSPSSTPPSLSPSSTNVPILNANTLIVEAAVLGVVIIGGTVGIFVLRRRKTSN